MGNRITAILLLMGTQCAAARLARSAAADFDRYIAEVETRLVRQHANADTYLATPNSESAARIQAVDGGVRSLRGALLHHWRAAAFVPDAAPGVMLALLRNYGHFSTYYAPQVVSSRALKDQGDTATIAMRFKEQKVITIVLDAEYQIESRLDGEERGYSISRSTHIWEVDNPGTARERRQREGDDDGYLWRLNSYWSFARVRGGLAIECEAVSLTRDVPMGLGWLLTPLIEELPREALEFTLKATRNALIARRRGPK
jgi:hypothetical protein